MAHVQIETDCEAFLRSLDNWDQQRPSFSSIVASAVHHAALRSGIGDLEIALAKHEVSCPLATIGRWAGGVARPSLCTQQGIVATLKSVVAAIVDADRKARAQTIETMRMHNHWSSE